MEKIVLEVSEQTARQWRNKPTMVRKRLAEQMNLILQSALDKEQDDLWPFLESIRSKAEKKRFNDEILATILEEA